MSLKPTYTWEIESLDLLPEYNGQTNVVATVHYKRIMTLNGETTSLTALIDVRNIAGGPFVPYAQLTPELVNNWVYSAITPAGVQALDQTLLNPVLANLQNQVPTPVPWSA